MTPFFLREELARQANYDLHTFFQNLRKNEKKRKKKAKGSHGQSGSRQEQ
jgi:hypothetical protein